MEHSDNLYVTEELALMCSSLSYVICDTHRFSQIIPFHTQSTEQVI